jgi:hypothetical protein
MNKAWNLVVGIACLGGGVLLSHGQEGDFLWDFQASSLPAGSVEPSDLASLAGAQNQMHFSVSRSDLVSAERSEAAGVAVLQVSLSEPPEDVSATAASLTINGLKVDPTRPLHMEVKFQWGGGPVSINTLGRFVVDGTGVLLPLGGISSNANNQGNYVIPPPGGAPGANGMPVPPATLLTVVYTLTDSANGLLLKTQIRTAQEELLAEEIRPEVPAPAGEGAPDQPPVLSLADLKMLSLTMSLNHRGSGSVTVDLASFRAWQ